jgi:hypothetical protein
MKFKFQVPSPKSKTVRIGLQALLVLLLAVGASAAPLSFPAKHEHLNGSCSGTLTFGEDGIRFEGSPHAARWLYTDVQQLQLLDKGRVQLITYKDSLLRAGADRAYSFRVEGDLKPVAALIDGKLERRLVLGWAQPVTAVLAKFAVKHLGTLRGDEGTLSFGEDRVVYESNDTAESRTWTYGDIESIATPDVFHLSLTTYERKGLQYAGWRVFNFQLKEPLREDIYNLLWQRVNRGRGLELFEKLRSDLEQQAAGAVTSNEREGNAGEPWGPGRVAAGSAAVSAAGSVSIETEARIEEGPADETSALPGATLPAAFHRSVDFLGSILREEGLPETFLGVARVESGFNPLALSPKNARGLWQFIPETARRYGLRVDARQDERTDPEKSTRAAARYLKDLYAMFGDWKLALAGYNAGEERVQWARSAAGTSNFEKLSRLLRAETRNYVPAVLAAIRGPQREGWPGLPRMAARGYRVVAPASLFPPPPLP